jgi:hypothetical protein
MCVIYKACVKRNQALMASDSWYYLHWFALGTAVTPDIALSEFKKCGFPNQGFEYSEGKTRDYSSSVATILTMVTVAIIIEKIT